MWIEVPRDTQLYELLGVPPDATEDAIKKAYRKKAKEHHPDKNLDDPQAATKFQEMAAAYEILSDPHERQTYDSFGVEGLGGARNREPRGTDTADFLADLFCNGGTYSFEFGTGGGPPRRRKGQNSVIPYDITLEDLYNGKTVKMNMEKEALCNICKGSGARGNAKPKHCSTCDGKGWAFVQTQVSSSTFATSRTTCSDCDGEGNKLREKDRCKKCKGKKTFKETTRQEIHVEKGMADRQRIVLAGAGDQEPGIPPGDVVFVLKLAPHSAFERSGNDLLTHVSITLSEALFGFSRILVTHLDGRGVRVSSPSGKIIKPHETIVLRGEGMPIFKQPDQKGNLYVVLEFEMPDERWLQSINRKTLSQLLPPKKEDLEPLPEIVDEAPFEQSDLADFGEDEDDWEDEDDENEDSDGEPECRHQ